MEITEIEKVKGSRYKIFVDGEYWYIIDFELIYQNNLAVGTNVTQELLEQIKTQAQSRTARERALYLLGYRDHSSKELYDKLIKSVDKKIASQTVQKMIEINLIDDEKYAKKLVQYFFETKRFGTKKIVFELMQKGIDKELAQKVVFEYNENNDNSELITELIEKKYARYLVDEKGKQKVINALLRLGHNFSDIKKALTKFIQIEDYYE